VPKALVINFAGAPTDTGFFKNRGIDPKASGGYEAPPLLVIEGGEGWFEAVDWCWPRASPRRNS
jgi:hypothetical protein